MRACKLGAIQQGIVFVCVKVSESSVFYIFQNETKSHIHFCCTFQIFKKMIKFLVHDCFVESFHCVIEYFVCRPFKLGIHQEMLTRMHLFSQPVILNISHYVFHIHISCSWSDLHSVLSVSMLTESVKSGKLLITKFTLEGEVRFWGALLLSNMIIQIILWFCGEIGTLGTVQSSNWTSFLVSYNFVSCSSGTTIFTCDFFFRDYRRHYNISSLTD